MFKLKRNMRCFFQRIYQQQKTGEHRRRTLKDWRVIFFVNVYLTLLKFSTTRSSVVPTRTNTLTTPHNMLY